VARVHASDTCGIIRVSSPVSRVRACVRVCARARRQAWAHVRGWASVCNERDVCRVDAARVNASRQRVSAKHSRHRERNLKAAESLIKKQRAQIQNLETRLTRAEKAANKADGDAAPQAHGTPRAAGSSSKQNAPSSKLYHVMHAPGARNVANHRDAVQYNYRHHDAAWDGNRIPTEGRGDRIDRQARNSRYPDYDAPSSPGGYNFVYGKDETYAPQDYGSYYGPQAYYDGYYRGGDGSTERATRNGAGRIGRGRQGRGRHVYAFASPYDRSEEFRQHENYVNGIYHWYTTVTNENQQQSISDAQKWQYNAALQSYDAYLRDQQADRD
jgi:hypothetical protein